MASGNLWRALALACALGVAACGGGGSNIASPGATNPGTSPGGGGPGGGPGGGGGGSASCPTGSTNAGALGSLTVCQLAGQILTNITLPRLTDVVYRISGRVDIGRDLGASGNQVGGQAATLTIAEGVTLYGATNADILIVNRGSRLVADGSAGQPIIFTSQQDVQGLNDANTSTRQWGGVIILGRAPIRRCSTAVTQGSVDCQNAIEGVLAATGSDALYGGATPTDNSGKLEFVQVRYAGAILPNALSGDDLNGITLGGVGSGTEIDFVQVHNNGDDGIEIFGGTVNLKHIVLTGELDDSFDCDDGWIGMVQFLVVRQSATLAGVSSSQPDRLVECSNHSGASSGGSLQTNPTIANFTMVGVLSGQSAGTGNGLSFNNSGGTPGATATLINGVVTGSSNCLSVHTTSPTAALNSILFDCPVPALDAGATSAINAGTNVTTNVSSTLGGVLPGPAEINHASVDPSTINAFFDSANYIGAFSDTETEATNWAAGWTVPGTLFANPGCPTGTTESGTLAGRRRCTLSGVIASGTVRLTAGNIYQIIGRVDVGVDRGAAGTGGSAADLVIDPGVTLAGASNADVLIVNRGSRIFANGTRPAPVILTSVDDVTGAQLNPVNATREWAGLIILGRAPIRRCSTAVTQGSVDCQNAIEGVLAATGSDALYGGATASDSSGRLNYVQVRYAGAILPNALSGDDLNGITLGGVGSGTEIDFVQVHNNGDDGIEIFGGAVNLKHVILTGELDDSFDCDDGWNGMVQFLLVIQSNTLSGVSSSQPDRLVECSNHSGASSGGSLQTNPTIANFTMVGVLSGQSAGTGNGLSFNNSGGTPGATARLINGVVIAASQCLSVHATSPVPVLNSILFDCADPGDTAGDNAIAAGTNVTTNVANSLAPAAAGGRPFINGSVETNATAFNPATVNPFFTATNYIGAVQNAGDTWWRTWSCGLESGSSC